MADASPKVSRSNIDDNVAIVPARRRVGHQAHIPGRFPGPSGSTKTGFSEEEDSGGDDPGSEVSEPELSIGRGVSLNPSPTKTTKGKKVGVRIAPKTSTEDEDDEDDDFAAQLKPLSARRKGSIAPIRIHNSNFDYSNPNGTSITDEEKLQASSPTPSAASISSLLREKLGHVPIPGMFRNKKPKEYKLQVFVSILFLTIILLVGSIYIIHKEKELQVHNKSTCLTAELSLHFSIMHLSLTNSFPFPVFILYLIFCCMLFPH